MTLSPSTAVTLNTSTLYRPLMIQLKTAVGWNITCRSSRTAKPSPAYRALYPLDNRVYFLTGSYGTGKSHLCLMLANYLSLKPNDVEMVCFFDNWRQRDPEGAEKLHNLRGEGRYLLALCEYGGGDDFDSMVLRSIQTAIDREELQEAWLDTHYQEAVRQIERWQARRAFGTS